MTLLALVLAVPAMAAGDPTATPSADPTATSTDPSSPSESAGASTTPTETASASATPTSTPTASATESTTPSATTTADGDAVEVDDGVLTWGLNNESSNRAYAPRTFNFFSAGRTPDPGKGGTTLPSSQWRQSKGKVAIQKWNGSAWRAATWAGLSTDSSGAALGLPTAGTFSNHRFVFRGGSGEVDRDAGTAHIEWDGDVTVLYYSGMSTFYISDPVLDVAKGKGTLTATVQGYASSVDDPDSWEPVAAETVTLATLPEVDLSSVRGFTATPAYLGVKVDGVGQVTGDDYTGAFPQSFVDYMDKLGTAAFWVSSGAATDPFKVALPLTIGYDASAPPVDPTPTAQPTTTPIDNPIVTAPATTAAAPVLTQPVPPAVVPPTAAIPPTSFAVASLPVASQMERIAPVSASTGGADGADATPIWWLGGGLLFAAALTLLIPLGKES